MCAEGVVLMDGAVSTMMQTQPSYSSGMGAADEEMSVMLQSNHANIRQSSLTGRMAPAASAGMDHLTSYSYSLYPPGYAATAARPMQRTASMPRGGPLDAPAHRSSPPQARPAFNMEKYVLEAKTEVLDATALRNGVSYGAVYESSAPSMLHRYHSAPASTFLAEIEGATVISSLYADGGLTPITENMDMEPRMGASGGGNSNFTEYEHYMAPENDFARRASFSSGLRKEEATSGNLLRQANVGISSLHDRMTENGSDKSSSRNSDDNNHLINGYTASMYSQEDFFWKSPTSPAKRQRGLEGESETSSGSADGSTYRNGHHGGLVRHMSLPSSACGPSSPGIEDNSFSTVPMRTRAKRGCATHPRSIAERVRRTKISERMKRLQDLVPDMDKQTNTSDMLDETVEYVKSLQRKVQELNETVAQLKAAAAAAQQNKSA